MTTIFFASHQAKAYTTESWRCIFSQWYIAKKPFIGSTGIYDIPETEICEEDWKKYVEGNEFQLREQFMMLMKALLFAKDDNRNFNLDIADKIMLSDNPAIIKSYGRKIKGFTDKYWDDWKYKFVVNGNYLQFSQNDTMKKILIGTGNREIVEASQKDNIWGIGYNQYNAVKVDKSKWGQNLLGKSIMEVREFLKQKQNNE